VLVGLAAEEHARVDAVLRAVRDAMHDEGRRITDLVSAAGRTTTAAVDRLGARIDRVERVQHEARDARDDRAMSNAGIVANVLGTDASNARCGVGHIVDAMQRQPLDELFIQQQQQDAKQQEQLIAAAVHIYREQNGQLRQQHRQHSPKPLVQFKPECVRKPPQALLPHPPPKPLSKQVHLRLRMGPKQKRRIATTYAEPGPVTPSPGLATHAQGPVSTINTGSYAIVEGEGESDDDLDDLFEETKTAVTDDELESLAPWEVALPVATPARQEQNQLSLISTLPVMPVVRPVRPNGARSGTKVFCAPIGKRRTRR
jgi:hypothetical protein